MRILLLTAIVIAGVSVFIIAGIFFLLNPVQETKIDQIPQENDLQKYNSSTLTQEQIISEAMQIALSDKKVQQMVDEKPVKLMSHGFYIFPSEPQLNLNVNNKTQLVVIVDLPTKKVTRVFIGSSIGECLCPSPSLSTASVGNRTVEVAARIYPTSTISTDTHYLWFRFFDANTNQTIQHVSFFLNITKKGGSVLHDLFHTDSGVFTLQIDSSNKSFNDTVFGNRDPILHGWMSYDNTPVIIHAPLFNQNDSSYNMTIVMYTIDRDNNLFGSNYPQFRAYLSMNIPYQIVNSKN